jgi:large subunit ribosomal protein L15
MKLNEIKPQKGATHKNKRVGCGPGSGHGKTSTRGHKGHKQRSGYRVKMGFEGGQTPLIRRLPKRGFFNISKTVYEVVNLSRLSGFDANAEVTPEILKQRGIIKGKSKLKILSQGELSKPLVIKAHSFSKKALEKIAGAGGRTEKIA